MSGDIAEWLSAWPFAACTLALVVLFAAALQLRAYGAGWRRWTVRASIVAAAVAAVIAANVGMYRHDAHLDLTRERAFTPSHEASDVVRRLQEPVELVYFYQKDNASGRATATMLELLARLNPRLVVEIVDIDRNPARAGAFGVQLYNTAVIVAGGQRLQLVATDDREIALGILRATRRGQPVVCFATGHGEYDIDNFEFHTHFEGGSAHNHSGADGTNLVAMEQHGLGRLRRAVERLGFQTRKVELRPGRAAPDDCAAIVDANPRTPYAPPEAELLRNYLVRGGAYMLLVEPDYPVEATFARVLADAGARIGQGVIVDPAEHYFTDEQMLAVTRYVLHPVTQSQALSVYPGARPVEPAPRDGIRAVALFASSGQSYAVRDRARYREEAASAPRRSYPLAVASEGTLDAGTRPYRLIVVGDADFASNSFFPYLANADIVLGGISWMMREDRLPNMKPPVEVLPQVTLTSGQVRWIFILCVILLPGAVALAGLGVFLWRRR